MILELFNIGDIVLNNPSKRDHENDSDFFKKMSNFLKIKNIVNNGTTINVVYDISNSIIQNANNFLTVEEYELKIKSNVNVHLNYFNNKKYIVLYSKISYETMSMTNKVIYEISSINKIIHSIYDPIKEEFLVNDVYELKLKDTKVSITNEDQKLRESYNTKLISEEPKEFNVMLTSLIYFTSWKAFTEAELLDRLNEQQQIYIDQEQLRKRIPLIIEKCAIDFFGESNVELKIDSTINDGKCYDLTIMFPEIVINNNLGLTHKIYDLFVKLVIYEDKISTVIDGIRSTRTELEVMSNYIHSHLPSRANAFNYESFCLGQSELNQHLIELSHMNSSSYKEEHFDILFCLLDNYVRYESLEGVPHIKMSTITSKNTNLPIISDLIGKSKLAYENLICNSNSNLNFSFTTDPLFNLVNASFLITDIEEELIPYVQDFVIKENGSYYSDVSIINLPLEKTKNVGKMILVFKGVEILYNIILDEKKENKGQKVPHPGIRKNVLETISKNFNNFLNDKEKTSNNVVATKS